MIDTNIAWLDWKAIWKELHIDITRFCNADVYIQRYTNNSLLNSLSFIEDYIENNQIMIFHNNDIPLSFQEINSLENKENVCVYSNMKNTLYLPRSREYTKVFLANLCNVSRSLISRKINAKEVPILTGKECAEIYKQYMGDVKEEQKYLLAMIKKYQPIKINTLISNCAGILEKRKVEKRLADITYLNYKLCEDSNGYLLYDFKEKKGV